MIPLNGKIFFATMLVAGLVVIGTTAEVRLAGDHRGYAPEQPIAFSHRLHAGDLAIDCLYCHYGARSSRTAGIPPASLCMNCHKQVTSSYDAKIQEDELAKQEGRKPRRIVSAEIAKLYKALGLRDDGSDDPDAKPQAIAWRRVHNLPDFVAFDHSVHVAKGVSCQSCHGHVQSFERMRQHESLSMGWCIDCHRQQAPKRATDCASCHY